MKRIILGIVLCQISLLAGAVRLNQAEDDTTKITRPFQLTFITPMGTNGLESGKITNRTSFNILIGYAGGLKGVEFGGMTNFLNGSMKGCQFAGFGNYVNGTLEGCQFAGFYNISKKYSRGTQFGGFVNLALDSADLIQGAGFVNVVHGKAKGAQFAGFANTANTGIEGIQLAGFTNISSDSVKGLQGAGFANIATQEMKGVQLSGFLNYAKKVKGLQLGVFNVADSVVKGVSIGVLSFVKNGYNKIEVEGGTPGQTGINVKLGLPVFYNILSCGLSLKNSEEAYWAYGYGIGTIIPLSNAFNLNIDAISYHINENEWFTEEVNMLNKLKTNLCYNPIKRLGIYGGPSLNVWISKIKNSEGMIIGSNLMPSDGLYEKIHGSTLVKITPGFNVGLRF